MKKMKVEVFGRMEWLEMTDENMNEVITDYYLSDTATEPLWSNDWEEWIEPGEEFYWVDEDPVPAYHDAMEWVIEEVIDIETRDY